MLKDSVRIMICFLKNTTLLVACYLYLYNFIMYPCMDTDDVTKFYYEKDDKSTVRTLSIQINTIIN